MHFKLNISAQHLKRLLKGRISSVYKTLTFLTNIRFSVLDLTFFVYINFLNHLCALLSMNGLWWLNKYMGPSCY